MTTLLSQTGTSVYCYFESIKLHSFNYRRLCHKVVRDAGIENHFSAYAKGAFVIMLHSLVPVQERSARATVSLNALKVSIDRMVERHH